MDEGKLVTRAFILGNGPSLKDAPFDRLNGEVTFAMNSVRLLWGTGKVNPKWHPTYFLMFDYTGKGWESDLSVGIARAKHSFIRRDRLESVPWEHLDFEWPPKVIVLATCADHIATDIQTNPKRNPAAWHLPQLCAYAGTMNPALQIAAMMGYNPIYLLGCDLGYTGERMGEFPDSNHFDPNYLTYSDHDMSGRDATLIQMHVIAKQETGALGIDVYNATPGGLLEVYPRVELGSIL